MTRIAAVAPALPVHRYTQAEITAELTPLLAHSDGHRAVLARTHGNTRIDTRHTALPLERYRGLGSFGETNALFIQLATELCAEALTTALDSAGIAPAEVDFILFTSVTGISAPSIDALLVARLGLRPDVKRLPSYGLGCVAGAAGIARVSDYLVGHPTEVGVLVAVELCSLTLQRGDASMANFVATGLFGDGAAAVVLVGDDRPEPGPTVRDTRSVTYPDSEGVIGFVVGETGFEIILTAEVAEVIGRHFPSNVASFLADNGLGIHDVDEWFAHPGGPRVLEAFADALRLGDDALARSYRSLAAVGNLSSVAVLHVLADGFAEPPGTTGLLFAVGPGVSAEFVLLEWPR
ncbi:type III polyketide synthase [Galbitalea soli]|uniref:Type III polyketide synthase n=1 Tax=Galbitalea soli TaxID=1268042 RepID=A0A7C9PPL5_9MICO|nr:3-oxoacyl-[acyl-carrier-protein] synthase III C-terminal domain-containing protein [Galbitalea soli]NEM92432.1 type III polyketide synthase [Galbitalea soli]NYJ29467.1 alkylresorcinol/alkylpyrone synthase [Galbitalea soli]